MVVSTRPARPSATATSASPKQPLREEQDRLNPIQIRPAFTYSRIVAPTPAENLKLGEGGEEGRDNDLLRETFVNYGIESALDEFSNALSPMLFGSAIRLFDGVDAGRVALEPVRAWPTQRVTPRRTQSESGNCLDLSAPAAEVSSAMRSSTL